MKKTKSQLIRKKWIKFDGTIPETGIYWVKIHGQELGAIVSVVNTFAEDSRNNKIHGFVIDTLSCHDSDIAECSGWIGKNRFHFIQGITHYKPVDISDYKNPFGLPMLKKIDGVFMIELYEPKLLN